MAKGFSCGTQINRTKERRLSYENGELQKKEIRFVATNFGDFEARLFLTFLLVSAHRKH
jgi:hypothetical protein